jgi:hypothetical protein
MQAKKAGRGGSREGSGRKSLQPGAETLAVPIRMTAEQKAKLKRLGGPPWVRSKIDKAKEPKE